MRITNTMMTNTTMRNVNKSKNNLYTTEQQMSSQKKISKPSDDPIIAIRALSLRTSLTEVEQYLKKNVPDAGAWLTLTETSLNNMDGIYKDIIKYCTQGSTDSYETTKQKCDNTEYTAVERCRCMQREMRTAQEDISLPDTERTEHSPSRTMPRWQVCPTGFKPELQGLCFTTTKYMKKGVVSTT